MKKVIIGGVVAAVLFFVLGVMMISMIAEGVYSDSAAAQQSQESGTVDPDEEIDFSGGIYAGGKFVFPAPKKLAVTSKFGMRIHPITGRENSMAE